MQYLQRVLEREEAHCAELTVGSEEYNASVERINAIEQKLNDARKIENDLIMRTLELEDAQKARKINWGIDVAKFGVGTIVMPLVILGVGIAAEKDITFTGLVKTFINGVVPRKY